MNIPATDAPGPQDISAARAWLQHRAKRERAVRIVFRLAPGGRVQVGMEGDLGRLEKLKASGPKKLWMGVAKHLVGRGYVQESGGEDSQAGKVLLLERGYALLRTSGHPGCGGPEEAKFLRDRKEHTGKKFVGEAKRGRRLTPHGRRMQMLRQIFRAGPDGVIDPVSGHTEREALEHLSEHELAQLRNEGLIIRTAGKLELTHRAVARLKSDGAQVRKRRKQPNEPVPVKQAGKAGPG